MYMGVGGRNAFQEQEGDIVIVKNLSLKSQAKKKPIRNISL